jgi:predicted metal-dependent hydrolase
MEMERKVLTQRGEITYYLTKKRVKNINLHVKSSGRIEVSAGHGVEAERVDKFVIEKQDFIFRALKKYSEMTKINTEDSHDFNDGEIFTILGQKLVLKVIKDEKESILVWNKELQLHTKMPESLGRKSAIYNIWIDAYVKAVLMDVYDRMYLLMSTKYDIPKPGLRLRSMKTRWGVCNITDCIITLNTKLIAAPIRAIEYVAVHEFSHLLEANHSKKFYAVIYGVMPDYEEREGYLRELRLGD